MELTNNLSSHSFYGRSHSTNKLRRNVKCQKHVICSMSFFLLPCISVIRVQKQQLLSWKNGLMGDTLCVSVPVHMARARMRQIENSLQVHRTFIAIRHSEINQPVCYCFGRNVELQWYFPINNLQCLQMHEVFCWRAIDCFIHAIMFSWFKEESGVTS